MKQEIDTNFYGVQIDTDGNIINKSIIQLYAVKNDYLFRQDNYAKIEITVPPNYQFDTTFYHGECIGIMTAPDLPMEYVTFISDIGATQLGVDLCLDFDQQWCAVNFLTPGGERVCIVGTANSDLDPMDIWNEWKHIIS